MSHFDRTCRSVLLLFVVAVLCHVRPIVVLADPESNTASIPTPKLEDDAYDWYGRHNELLKIKGQIDPEIIMIGDSITHFWAGPPACPIASGPKAWKELFGDRRVLNLGFGWDRTQNVLWRLDNGEIDGLHPRFVVVNIGSNNFFGTPRARANTPAEIAEAIRAICERIRAKTPESHIIVMGVFPRYNPANDPVRAKIAELNKLLAKLHAPPKVTFLDIDNQLVDAKGDIPPTIMADTVHPTEGGYKIWAAALKPLLEARSAAADAKQGGAFASPITQGQRVVFAGHSFQCFAPPILDEIVQSAAIPGHMCVAKAYLGGSSVMSHWQVPDEQDTIRKALCTGTIDFLALSPIYLPDEGIEKFTQLSLKHNPTIRIGIQDIWLRWDVYEPTANKSIPELCAMKVDHNAITADELRVRHAPLFASIDACIQNANKRLGKSVLFVVPAGQAVIALREQIIAGKVPGLKTQEELFIDPCGHGSPALQALVTYCYFSTIYRRSPVGLPLPAILSKDGDPQTRTGLNLALQKVAWKTATEHPLSGIRTDIAP